MMAVVALLGIILFTAVNYSPMIIRFIRFMTVNQAVNMDARRCADTISRLLANSLSGTISISSPGPGAPPYSTIAFAKNDGFSYQIFWSSAPANSVHLSRTPTGPGTPMDSVIASNVASLMFFLPDFRDASIIQFTVQMSASSMGGSLIANQTVQTVTRQ